MTRVRMLADRAGNGWVQCQGAEIDVTDAEARHLVATEQAELIDEHENEPVPAAADTSTIIKNQRPRRR